MTHSLNVSIRVKWSGMINLCPNKQQIIDGTGDIRSIPVFETEQVLT